MMVGQRHEPAGSSTSPSCPSTVQPRCAASVGTPVLFAAIGIFTHVPPACRVLFWIARRGAEG